jgi:hypothetical protein
MKRIITLFVFLTTTLFYAQNSGITYQAVLYNPSGEILPGNNNSNAVLSNKDICLRFSIKDATTNLEYQETQKVKTDEFGMVNLVVGKGNQVGGYASNFDAIVWNSSNKKLQVEIDVTGNCSSFIEISDQDFSAVPFAYASKTAENVSGIVAIANGGTGASTVVGAKTNLGLNNVDNTSDANKPISTATQAALDTKAPLASPALTGTPTVPTATIGTNTTQIASTAFVNSAIAAATTPDATETVKGKIKLTGDLGGTADAPTVATNAITSAKILDGTIATADLASASVTNAKIGETITVANGGTGAGTLTGYVKGTGTTAMTASLTIPVADVTGAQTSSNLSNDIAADTGSESKYPSVKAVETVVTSKVGGSGTTNFIPKFTATSTLGNSSIFDNGNVGIGTTSPISLFSNAPSGTNFVGSNGATQSSNGISWLTNSTGYNTSLYNAGTAAGSNGLQVKVASTSDQTYAFQVGQNANLNGTSTSLFNVLGNGNVGIGNNNPLAKLEITSGTTGASGLRFTNLTSAATPIAGTRFLSVDASGNVIYATTGLTLPLITANGTNSATTEVRDYNVWANRGNGFYLADAQAAIANGIPNNPGWFSLSQVANGSNFFGQTALNDQGFWFRGGATSAIASNTWLRTLSVNANSRFAAQWDNATNNTITLNNRDNGPLAFATHNIERMRILAEGNVGIGTTAPTAQLHTTGSVRFAGAGTPGPGKVLTSDADGNATWQSTPVNIKQGDYTLTANDSKGVVIMDSNDPVTVTVPATLTAGFFCQIIQKGTGKVTVVRASGVTINSANGFKTRAQFSSIGVLMESGTEGYISGDSEL